MDDPMSMVPVLYIPDTPRTIENTYYSSSYTTTTPYGSNLRAFTPPPALAATVIPPTTPSRQLRTAPQSPFTTPTHKKRPRKENEDPTPKKKRKKGPPRTRKALSVIEKIAAVEKLMMELGWSWGSLLHYVFFKKWRQTRPKNADSTGSQQATGGKISTGKDNVGDNDDPTLEWGFLEDNEDTKSVLASSASDPIRLQTLQTAIKRHAALVSSFMDGRDEYKPVDILHCWLTHPYGSRGDTALMFSLDTPYAEVKPVRASLTACAAQLVRAKMTREAESAVKRSSGLHISISRKGASNKYPANWNTVLVKPLKTCQSIVLNHQPLTYGLFANIAARSPRVIDGAIQERKRRPTDAVVTHSICSLNYSRTSNANLLPVATGLFQFSSGASADQIAHGSRLSQMPAYSTMFNAMQAFSNDEGVRTHTHGSSPNTIGIMRIDNVQNYLLQQDQSIGRQDKLNIGIGGTYYEGPEEVDPSVFDMDSKRAKLAEKRRETLGVPELVKFIDNEHMVFVGSLQWLSALVNHIPQLQHYRSRITSLYQTQGSKIPLKPTPAKVHSLASSGKNETVYPELKDALLDFLQQTGQTEESHKSRIFPIEGDGLTFEKILQLKEFLQLEGSQFSQLEIIEPLLAIWHTLWTYLSQICEMSWGSPSSSDPATLAFSAGKIGRKPPPNLKKVDFYSASRFVYLSLEARMLDCWRIKLCSEQELLTYFEKMAKKDIPTFEVLKDAARVLHQTYATSRAATRAMSESSRPGTSKVAVPLGSVWDPATRTIPDKSKSKKKKKSSKEKTKSSDSSEENAETAPDTPNKSDHCLARSILFMRDAIIAREIHIASADGDPGRIWEAFKVLVFMFAGSSHKKYATYLLEMVTKLELESSPALKHALLRMSLVNLSGRPGHFAAGDFVQEYFNRILEAVVQRKGVEYGGSFIRNVWSRNLYAVAQLKSEWLPGLGVTRHSSHHTRPDTSPEISILIRKYRAAELHLHRAGRRVEEKLPVDCFDLGTRYLQNGALKKWTTRTSRSRSLRVGPEQSSGSLAIGDRSGGNESSHIAGISELLENGEAGVNDEADGEDETADADTQQDSMSSDDDDEDENDIDVEEGGLDEIFDRPTTLGMARVENGCFMLDEVDLENDEMVDDLFGEVANVAEFVPTSDSESSDSDEEGGVVGDAEDLDGLL